MIALAKRLLSARRFPLYVALLAVLLVLPTIGSGLMLDDYAHRSLFVPGSRAQGGPRGDWDLFHFQGADEGYFNLQLERGLFPWWTSRGLRLAFMRPLTSLSHALDYRAFPDVPAIMHAENIALYGLVAGIAALFYRRIIADPMVAGIAGFLYAADDAHGFVVAWIANRNALLAAVFGLASLIAHDRCRRDGWRPGAYAAPLAFALGMLSGEAAISTLPYLLAYTIFLDPGTRWERARALVPYALVFVAYAVVYTALGYGARGGGMYIDPAREPLAFLSAVGGRLPVLLLAQLAFPPADIAMVLSETRVRAFLPVAIGAASALAALLWLGARKEKTAAFWAAGMLLSLVPVCATVPSDRLLLFPGIGAFGLVALFLAAARAELSKTPFAARGSRGKASSAALALASLFFVVMHAVIAPLLLPARAVIMAQSSHSIVERSNATLPPEGAMAGRFLIVVNAPDPLCVGFALADRSYHGKAMPRAVRLLAMVSEGEERLLRKDERTLEMTATSGLLRDAISKVFRHPDDAFHVGDVVQVPGMTAEIMSLAEDGKRPRTVSFRFDEPLEDPAHLWVLWSGQGFVPFTPPAVGEERILPSISVQAAYMGE